LDQLQLAHCCAWFGWPPTRCPQPGFFFPWHHMRLSVCRLAMVCRVLENMPHSLAGPNSLTSSSQFTTFLKPTADLGKAAAVLSDPREDLPDYPGLLRYWLKSRLTSNLANRYIAVPEWSTGHDVERPALGRVLLASPTPLHDLGPLVFGDDALYLQ